MNTILVAIDFSNSSSEVLKKAIFISNMMKSDLKVVHVVEDNIFNFHKDSSRIKFNCLKYLKEEFPTIKEKDFYLKVGTVEDEIFNLSKELKSLLVITGASGENFSLENFFMGSTTKKLIRTLEIPTLIIKNSIQKEYKKILIPTDFSEDSKYVIENTLKFFPNSLIQLLHMYNIPFKNRLNMYGIDNETSQKYYVNMTKKVFSDGDKFMSSVENCKDKLSLKVENDTLVDRYINDENENSNEFDLISLHTTGNISFFTFDILDKSKYDVLVFKK